MARRNTETQPAADLAEEDRRGWLRHELRAAGSRCFVDAERLLHLGGVVHDVMGEMSADGRAREIAATATALDALATHAASVASSLLREAARLSALARARDVEESADGPPLG